jgi:hypothetical protein
MRTTFILDDNNHAQSDERAKGLPHQIEVGMPVAFTGPYKTSAGEVPVGAKGFVSFIDEDLGAVWILMEGIEPALVHWDNMLVLMPYNTEDLLAVLEFKKAPSALHRRVSTYLRLLAASLICVFN